MSGSNRFRGRRRSLAIKLLALSVAIGVCRSNVWSQRPPPPTPPKPAPAPAPPPGSTAAPAIAVFGVKRFGLATPVTGSTSIAVIELNGRAPPGGVTIQLSSSNPATASVRPNIVVPAGMTSETFEVTTFAVSLTTDVTITAVPKGGTAAPSASLTVVPPALAKLDCGSSTITAGTTATCTVSLNGSVAAGSAAIEPVVSLTSSNPTLGAIPAQVGVKQGEKVASFALKATPIAQSAPLVISASYAGVTKSLALTLVPAPLRSLRLRGPRRYQQSVGVWTGVPWGWPVQVIIDLTAPAPAGGMVIQLTSDRPQLAQPPQAVRIPAGQASDSFDLPTRPAPLGTAVTIQASVPHVGQAIAAAWKPYEHPLRASTVGMLGWHLYPGNTESGRVSLWGTAPPGGIEVRLTNSDPAVVSMPNAVKIPAGSSEGSYQIQPKAVGPHDHQVFFRAEVPGSGNVVSVAKVIRGSVLDSLYASSSVVDSVPFGGVAVTATVRLRYAAPAGGAAVSLKYAGGTDITGPASVTVAAGEREKLLQVHVSPCSVNPPCTVTITGTYGDTKIATLVVKP